MFCTDGGAEMVPHADQGRREAVMQGGDVGENNLESSSESESEEEGDVEFPEEDESKGMELVFTGENPGDRGDISEQAVQNVASKAGTREKLQVRGRGQGSKGLRRMATSEEGDVSPTEVRGAAGRGRGRRGRGRGRERNGRGGADGGESGSTYCTGGDSASADSDDKPLGDVLRRARGKGSPHRARLGNVNDRDRAQLREADARATFEASKEVAQWLSEITIISSWHSDAQLAGTTAPGLRLAFDGSEECGPTVTLPLFKSAIISNSAEVQQGVGHPCNDIVLHIGGPVWALDWCPQRLGWVHSGNEKSEFLAIGAHPSSTPYNRLGKPLRGQGLLQIWAFDFSTIDQLNSNDSREVEINTKTNKGSSRSAGKRPRTSSREKSSGIGRMRGSRVSRVDVTADFQGDLLLLEEDAPMSHSVLSTIDSGNAGDAYVVPRKSGSATQSHPASSPSGKRPRKLKESARARNSDTGLVETRFPRWHKEEGPAKMVLGLVHDGLVTWDAKWRPVGKAEHNLGTERELLRLGFLALLLGDGTIQVFDVPLPSILTTRCSQGAVSARAPPIVHIEPVFKCSDLQSGGHMSVPISLEWSTWDPHDLILVGFHDATVGLWKFSSNLQQPEARPLMFFTADTLPLRSVAWAPDASGSSGKHVFVTAGHTGWVKFWDIRDPFRPFWDLQVSRGCIHSLDWIPWPRCLLMTLDDGTLRILGLDNASSHTPTTGEPWRGTHSQGIQCFLCSSFPIWDAQVSRRTGVVAYAGASGSVLQFQLTERAIVKEGARAREPHYLCGAFVADSEFGPVTLTSLQKTAPAQMKKSSTEWSSRPRTMRGFLATCTLDNESRQVSTGLELAISTESSPSSRVRKKHSKAIGKIRRKEVSQSSLCPKAELQLLPSTDDRMALVPFEMPVSTEYEFKGEQNLPQTNNFRVTETPAQADNFPWQKVSVHRLRWNCNPNREHWLTYGGAAGIVRCQQVFSMKKKQKDDF